MTPEERIEEAARLHKRELALSGLHLTAIPEALAQLTFLRYLELSGNPLPAEWQAAIQRGEAPEYLRSLAKASEVVSPRTVEVVLLGEPESGKTTLREALAGNPEPCDGAEMYLNVSDFAGQQIEHSTHADRTPPDLPWPDIRRLSGEAFEGHYDVGFEDLRGF
jgi:hypothetical protein